MENKNIKKTVIISLLILNLCGTAFLASLQFSPDEANGEIPFHTSENGKYSLYIGTNDKDTYEQIIPTEEAKDIINAICAKYVGGYTVADAKGGWVDEKSNLTQENTLVYSFYDISEEAVISIMDEVLKELNQNTILVEVESPSYAYYDGK